MQYNMMSSETTSFINDQNTSLQMKEYPLQYASTDKNKKSHYRFLQECYAWCMLSIVSYPYLPHSSQIGDTGIDNMK